jgi:hypothetical protein
MTRFPRSATGRIRKTYTPSTKVSLSSLKRITSTMALFIADWCGLEPIAK